MTGDTSTDGTDRSVYWCEHCTEQVGTDGDEPENDCPTCGHSDWKHLADRSVDTGTEQTDGPE